MKLAIILVSWNTCDLLRRCLATVYASLERSGLAALVVVVDNASSDGTPSMVRSEYPAVHLIAAGRNLGFAGANNLALRRVLDERSVYVMLLNPDTEVVDRAIGQMVAYMEAHSDVAVLGPLLRYPDGQVQSSRRRFPTRLTFFWESTPLAGLWPHNPWIRRYHYADQPADRPQAVDWLVGAAILVRCSAIIQAGLLDAGFLMYSEELEWQRRIQRIWRAGQPGGVVFLPEAEIIHYEGQSSAQVGARRYLDFQRSRLRDAGMVYGQAFAALLRLFLVLCYGGELGVESAKWMLGHKRSLRAERVGVYWRVVCGLIARDPVALPVARG